MGETGRVFFGMCLVIGGMGVFMANALLCTDGGAGFHHINAAWITRISWFLLICGVFAEPWKSTGGE